MRANRMGYGFLVLVASLMVFSAPGCKPSEKESTLSLNRKFLKGDGKQPDFQSFSALPLDRQEYILRLWALFDPQVALDYLHTRSELRPSEKQAAVIALKIQKQSPEVISGLEKTWLYPTSKYEKSVLDMSMPNPKHPLAQYREEVKVVVTTTQRLRRELDGEIADKPAEIQLRIIAADRDLENRVGSFLRSVPPPPKVKGKKLANYKQGMMRISQEFFHRANELSQRESQIRQNDSPPSARPNMETWPWPKGLATGEGGFSALHKAFSEKDYLGGILQADLLRTDLLKSDADYYSVRTGLLLMQSGDEPMRRYALDELVRAKQTGLINSWKTLASGAPNPGK